MTSKTFQEVFLLSNSGNPIEAKRELINALPYETQEGVFIAHEFVNWLSSSPSSMTKHFNAAIFYLFHQNKEKAKKVLIQDFEETNLEVSSFLECALDWIEEILSSQKETSLKTHFLWAANAHAEENNALIIPCKGETGVSITLDTEGNKTLEGEIIYENEQGNLFIEGTGGIKKDKEGNYEGELKVKGRYRF